LRLITYLSMAIHMDQKNLFMKTRMKMIRIRVNPPSISPIFKICRHRISLLLPLQVRWSRPKYSKMCAKRFPILMKKEPNSKRALIALEFQVTK
jgi:hypothetical protein